MSGDGKKWMGYICSYIKEGKTKCDYWLDLLGKEKRSSQRCEKFLVSNQVNSRQSHRLLKEETWEDYYVVWRKKSLVLEKVDFQTPEEMSHRQLDMRVRSSEWFVTIKVCHQYVD